MIRWLALVVFLCMPLLAVADVERIAPTSEPPALEVLFPGRLERIAPPAPATLSERVKVVVAIPFLAELTEALCEDTGIHVHAVLYGVHIPMASMPRAMAERESEWVRAAADATACVTLRGAWPADPLYPLVRRHNIRTVEIDATRPLDGSGPGIALLGQSSRQDAPPPYVWLHPGNALRMAEIVAADLARLAPGAATQIRDNLTAWREPSSACKTSTSANSPPPSSSKSRPNPTRSIISSPASTSPSSPPSTLPPSTRSPASRLSSTNANRSLNRQPRSPISR